MNELEERKNRGRAEILYCLDTLIRHFNDEERTALWLSDGIPDGTCEKDLDEEQIRPYRDFVHDDEFGYDDMVKLGVKMLFDECFKRKLEYRKGALY